MECGYNILNTFPFLFPSIHFPPPPPSSPSIFAPHQTPFVELQPDALNAQVLKYAKTVYQLEKGLPPNGVVPKLKGMVEDMKDKVSSVCVWVGVWSLCHVIEVCMCTCTCAYSLHSTCDDACTRTCTYV